MIRLKKQMTEEIYFPDYLELKENRFGLGTYTKKAIKKGELVMRSRAKMITYRELLDKNSLFDIYLQNKKFQLDKKKCTSVANGKIYLFTSDAFINHSCEPNIFNRDAFFDKEYFHYSKYAIKDITAGEELFTNYLFFDNESDFEFLCKCQSEYCFGIIKGKNHLTNEQMQFLNKQICEFNQ